MMGRRLDSPWTALLFPVAVGTVSVGMYGIHHELQHSSSERRSNEALLTVQKYGGAVALQAGDKCPKGGASFVIHTENTLDRNGQTDPNASTGIALGSRILKEYTYGDASFTGRVGLIYCGAEVPQSSEATPSAAVTTNVIFADGHAPPTTP